MVYIVFRKQLIHIVTLLTEFINDICNQFVLCIGNRTNTTVEIFAKKIPCFLDKGNRRCNTEADDCLVNLSLAAHVIRQFFITGCNDVSCIFQCNLSVSDHLSSDSGNIYFTPAIWNCSESALDISHRCRKRTFLLSYQILCHLLHGICIRCTDITKTHLLLRTGQDFKKLCITVIILSDIFKLCINTFNQY